MNRVRMAALLIGGMALGIVPSVSAQSVATLDSSVYRVEAHVGAGPMASVWVRGRQLPKNAESTTLGYNSIFRIMWHPNHMLATGVLTGYQLIVAEDYFIPDSLSSGAVRASLHAMPLMFDVSMQGAHFEGGVAFGAYLLTTYLDDQTIARASRFELGTIFHLSYRWPLTGALSIGTEAFMSYMGYRGIFSIAPQLDIRYDLFSY